MGLSGVSSTLRFTQQCWTRLYVGFGPWGCWRHRWHWSPPTSSIFQPKAPIGHWNDNDTCDVSQFCHKHTEPWMLGLSLNVGENKTRGRSRLDSRSTLPLSLSLNPNYHPLALRVIIAPGFPENTPVSSRFYYLLFHFVISSSFTLEYCRILQNTPRTLAHVQQPCSYLLFNFVSLPRPK